MLSLADTMESPGRYNNKGAQVSAPRVLIGCDSPGSSERCAESRRHHLRLEAAGGSGGSGGSGDRVSLGHILLPAFEHRTWPRLFEPPRGWRVHNKVKLILHLQAVVCCATSSFE